MKATKTKTPKKENKQVVEIHIYIHQTGGNYYQNPNILPNTFPQNPPWNQPYTLTF